MSKVIGKLVGLFRSSSQVGVDKVGNRYFSRVEQIDGITKEKRWVIFKGEEDPTSLPVEWICWLNGQRKKVPTLQESLDLEARRQQVKINVAYLQKEEEERKLKFNHLESRATDTVPDKLLDKINENTEKTRSAEPTGSGSTFKPGTWQPET